MYIFRSHNLGFGTQIDEIWSSDKENIVLNLPDGKTSQLYLADVLEQLETEITNKKHITNQPAKVSDAVEEIDRDVTKELVKYSRFMSSGSSLYRPCTLVVRYFSRKIFG